MRRLTDSGQRLRTPAGTRVGLLLCLLLLSPASWSEIYRWVDEDGRVHFSDRVPPPVSKLERHVLDDRGNLREVLQRQRTVEELEQHRQRLAAIKSEQELRARQEQYDRYLRSSFQSLEQLEALRDERMEIRDNQIANLSEDLAALQIALGKERERRSENVVAQQNLIRSLESDAQALKEQIQRLEKQRRKEFEGLSQDMQRFEYLRLQDSMYGNR